MKEDIIGHVYGNLVVKRRVEDHISASGRKRERYECECECGALKSVLMEQLIYGRTKSCGCLRKKHNQSYKAKYSTKTRLYKIWVNMRNRCMNVRNPAYCDYGQRGITVCEEWESYENFMSWACESGYNDSLTIDRIDNNAGYCPQNCRWADRYEQANNKRNNVTICFDGKTNTVAEWSKIIGIPYKVLYDRVYRYKWSVEDAFSRPVRSY